MLVEGGAAPENFTTKIKRFNPTHIVFIDAADIGGEPGSVTLIAPERIVGSAFTHRLPLSFLADYLKTQINARILVIGIQPENLKFSDKISQRVERAIKELESAIKKSISADQQTS
jgi:hydrogenase 3 maturation protease